MATQDVVNIPMKHGGDGKGKLGHPVLFTIDGKNIDHSRITCRCMAPSGIMTEILVYDNRDGTYGIDLNPTEPGLHTVEIECNGKQISGSPFFVKIMQQQKRVQTVSAYGPGLMSGLMNNFKGEFKIDTTNGGAGSLDVSVTGPKEEFKIDMRRNKENKRIIDAQYNPTSSGIYTVNVLWEKSHVEGSPFRVILGKSKKEFDDLVKLKR